MTKQTDHVGKYFTVQACAAALGVSKTAIRYRVMKYRLPVHRIGPLDFVHLPKLRAVFEHEKSGQNPQKENAYRE